MVIKVINNIIPMCIKEMSYFYLRIDNCGWALFHKSAYISEAKYGILVNHTSNERSYFSLSYDQ